MESKFVLVKEDFSNYSIKLNAYEFLFEIGYIKEETKSKYSHEIIYIFLNNKKREQ